MELSYFIYTWLCITDSNSFNLNENFENVGLYWWVLEGRNMYTILDEEALCQNLKNISWINRNKYAHNNFKNIFENKPTYTTPFQYTKHNCHYWQRIPVQVDTPTPVGTGIVVLVPPCYRCTYRNLSQSY